jgi:hypothetical protein
MAARHSHSVLHLIQIHNSQKRKGNWNCRLTTQAKKSRIYMILLYSMYNEIIVIGMYSEKSQKTGGCAQD